MSDDLTPAGKPKPFVPLLGESGNAFAVIGRVIRALRTSGHTAEEVDRYQQDAMAGDYDHLLQVTLRWVEGG